MMIKHLTKDSTLKTDTKRTVEEKEISKMETSKIKTKPILNNLRRRKKRYCNAETRTCAYLKR